MVFCSFEFILLFIPPVLILYFLFNHLRLIKLGNYLLIAASIGFYAIGANGFLHIFLLSILLNYYFSRVINRFRELGKTNYSRIILVLAILFNVLLLGYYKYENFVFENINFVFGTSWEGRVRELPLGISFFTFQLIAYLVDSFRGYTKDNDMEGYLLFICFFPQLIVGPIIHHKDVIYQFKTLRRKFVNYKNLSIGIFLFVLGMSKKVLLADPLTKIAAQAFNDVSNLTLIDAWVNSVGYTISYLLLYAEFCLFLAV